MGSKSKIQFEDFCQQTSIHGWSFLSFRGYGSFQVLFWVTIIATSLSGCMYMISANIQEFNKATVEFETISLTESLDDIFFPSIFIINSNQQRKSYLMAMIQENNLTEVLDVKKLIQFLIDSHHDNQTDPQVEELWKGILQSPVTSQLFDYFVEQNQDKRPKQYFSWKLYHNHSIQYKTTGQVIDARKAIAEEAFWSPKSYLSSILSHTNLDDFLINYKFSGAGILHVGGGRADNSLKRNRFTPFFQKPEDNGQLRTLKPFVKNGISNGVELLLDAEVYDNTFLYQKSIGFQLGINHPFDVSLASSSGCFLQPGKQVLVAVKASVIETEKEIRQRFDYNGTKCHFDDEVELDHFPRASFRYSMNNCMLESFVQKGEELCNCSHLVAGTKPLKGCTGDGMTCIDNNDIGQENGIRSKGEHIPCLANCNDIEYSTSVSTATYNNVRNFNYYYGYEFCLVLKKIMRSCHTFKRLTLNERYPGICTKLKPFQLLEFSCNRSFISFKVRTAYYNCNYLFMYLMFVFRETLPKKLLNMLKTTLEKMLPW